VIGNQVGKHWSAPYGSKSRTRWRAVRLFCALRPGRAAISGRSRFCRRCAC